MCGRVECVGGRGEGLDSPGGRIGVSLLTGAKFGDKCFSIAYTDLICYNYRIVCCFDLRYRGSVLKYWRFL